MLSLRHRIAPIALAVMLGFGVTVSTGDAHADDLETQIASLSEEDRSARLVEEGTRALTSGAALASGIALLSENSGTTQGYVLTGLGGLGILTSTLELTVGARPIEELQIELSRIRATNAGEDDVRIALGTKWNDLARRARRRRQQMGALSLGVGIATVAAGTVLAVTGSPRDATSGERGATSLSLVLGGSTNLLLGLHGLMSKEPIELGYDIFRATGSRASRRSALRIDWRPGRGLAMRMSF
jgi:hypothetical protein